MVMPGDNSKFFIELITPIAMEEGLRFAIREGGRTEQELLLRFLDTGNQKDQVLLVFFLEKKF